MRNARTLATLLVVVPLLGGVLEACSSSSSNSDGGCICRGTTGATTQIASFPDPQLSPCENLSECCPNMSEPQRTQCHDLSGTLNDKQCQPALTTAIQNGQCPNADAGGLFDHDSGSSGGGGGGGIVDGGGSGSPIVDAGKCTCAPGSGGGGGGGGGGVGNGSGGGGGSGGSGTATCQTAAAALYALPCIASSGKSQSDWIAGCNDLKNLCDGNGKDALYQQYVDCLTEKHLTCGDGGVVAAECFAAGFSLIGCGFDGGDGG